MIEFIPSLALLCELREYVKLYEKAGMLTRKRSHDFQVKSQVIMIKGTFII